MFARNRKPFRHSFDGSYQSRNVTWDERSNSNIKEQKCR